MNDPETEDPQRLDRPPARLDSTEWPALMRRSQDGDRAAYRTLLVAVTPYVRAVASRFLRQPTDVEDAVQDILMTIHAIRHTYDPERPFKPWLAGVARHRLLDRARGLGRISAREVELTMEHETFAADEPNRVEEAWDVPALHAAVRSLPRSQRRAIELLKLREMSLKEAAVVSGLSITALKVATHRGLRTLRRLLGGNGSSQ